LQCVSQIFGARTTPLFSYLFLGNKIVSMHLKGHHQHPYRQICINIMAL
jgi:hypothetical protein